MRLNTEFTDPLRRRLQRRYATGDETNAPPFLGLVQGSREPDAGTRPCDVNRAAILAHYVQPPITSNPLAKVFTRSSPCVSKTARSDFRPLTTGADLPRSTLTASLELTPQPGRKLRCRLLMLKA